MSARTRSHVAHCSSPAGTRLRRGCGNVCSTTVALTSVGDLSEDAVPAGLELRVVVDELLAERREDHVRPADALVHLRQRVQAVLRRVVRPERREAGVAERLLAR